MIEDRIFFFVPKKCYENMKNYNYKTYYKKTV